MSNLLTFLNISRILFDETSTETETTTQGPMQLGNFNEQEIIAIVVCMAIAVVIIFGILIYKKKNK